MGSNSKIEWTDHTFNPWIGCHKVSPGCDHCYAESMARRNWPGHWGPPATTPRRMMSEAYWRQPLRWNAEAERTGVRRRVFCASLADVWEPHPAVASARARLCELIEATPHLDWLLLTKRPEMIPHLQPESWRNGWPRNAWAGCTVENQEQADRRVPHLLRVPAKVRFLSCEPLLGPVDLGDIELPEKVYRMDALTGLAWYMGDSIEPCGYDGGLHWVICGGESGPHARPMHPDWARRLRDQCREAGVPFFFKQHGEWAPGTEVAARRGRVETTTWFADAWHYVQEELADAGGHTDDEPDLYRVGKRAAGRLLDGRTWDELPGSEGTDRTNGTDGTSEVGP